MKMSELIILKRLDLLRLAARHGAHNVRLFGSASELMHLAMQSASFDWLAHEAEDLYAPTDGEEPVWPRE
jgi:hypothetical protein